MTKKKLTTGKTGVYIRLDQEVIAWAKKESAKLGLGYQTFINMELRKKAGFAK